MRLSLSTCLVFLILGCSLVKSEKHGPESLLSRIEELLEKST